MLFKQSGLLLVLTLVAVVMLGLWPGSQRSEPPSSGCQLDQGNCTWPLDGGQVELVLKHPPVKVEQPFTLDVYTEGLDVETIAIASLSGLNMSMGNIPVVFERLSRQHWQAQVMLGACAEPVMHWLLTFRLELVDGRTRQWNAHFYAYRK